MQNQLSSIQYIQYKKNINSIFYTNKQNVKPTYINAEQTDINIKQADA